LLCAATGPANSRSTVAAPAKFAGGEVVEQPVETRERTTGAIERGDGVVEIAGAGLEAIASSSARCSLKAASKAGLKCSACTLAKGGSP